MAIVKFGHASIPVSIGIKYITNSNKTDELDKILEKMRAHGIRITKAQLYHARNDIYNAEQNQDQGFDLIM